MKTTHRNPKLLSWLANKARITEDRAEALWLSAQHHAASRGHEAGTPAHSQAAMDRLHELVAAESLREDAASFGLRRWSRLNDRMLMAPISLLDAAALTCVRGWRLAATMPMRLQG